MNPVDSWGGATILADPDDDIVGKTLNDTYAVERILGEGGMGRVYQARHTRIAQKRVAIKLLHPEYMRNGEMLARFQREAEAAASICHPNVVAVYDVDRSPRGLPYLVCEYLDGLDLGQRLTRQGKLALPSALHVTRQLCAGLAAAHGRGVIHRDLKPQNVFLVGDTAEQVPDMPLVKILDFGLSKFIDVADGQLVTKTGVVMGTPAFMAPEQALGQRVDLRADIYGVGAILYTCLTGRIPFNETTPHATMLAVIGNEPPRPRVLDPSIPEYAELVIQRAMAKQPTERFVDMASLLQALDPLGEDRQIQYEVGTAPVRRGTFDARIEFSSASRPKFVLLLCMVLALLLGSVAVAVVGLEQIAGWSLSRRELALLFACMVAVAATPMLLILRRIQTSVWGNTNRVLGLSTALRAALLTAVIAYGLAWFGFRLIDAVVLRLLGEPLRANITWPGWDLLLPVIALGTGTVALLRERAMSEMLRGWRRAMVATAALLTTIALAAIVIPLGLRWQTTPAQVIPARSKPAPSATPAMAWRGTARPDPSTPSGTSMGTAPKASAAPNPTSHPAQVASEDELRAATAQGTNGWLTLAERYPNDARILRSLVLAHASRAAELADAMQVMRRLLQVSPDEAKSGDLQYLVQRAAETPGPPAEIAWKMLADEMGTHGPDLLYSLVLNKPKLAERAERLLAEPTLRQRSSPALGIAMELRAASSCSARLALLDRAVEVGDERAIAVLGGLSTGAPRGCGKNKRKACAPACPEQVEPFRAAMNRIAQRLKAAEQ